MNEREQKHRNISYLDRNCTMSMNIKTTIFVFDPQIIYFSFNASDVDAFWLAFKSTCTPKGFAIVADDTVDAIRANAKLKSCYPCNLIHHFHFIHNI